MTPVVVANVNDVAALAVEAVVTIVAPNRPTPEKTTIAPLGIVAFWLNVTVDTLADTTVPIAMLVDPLKYQAVMPTATPGTLAKFNVVDAEVALIVVSGNPFLLFGSQPLTIVFCEMLTRIWVPPDAPKKIGYPAEFLIVLLMIEMLELLNPFAVVKCSAP
ncbi:hypothetical protein WJ15_31420 [Burkholderia cepacia]|nr:hypothetical protein WJ15_31420 [Burkholderia cepacia]